MSFLDILHLALRNLRQARLRFALTTMGVVVGVAVIVTMMSFGLGLQQNMLGRFKALDFFNEIQVFGQGLNTLAGIERGRGDGDRRRERADKAPTRILDDAGVAEIAAIPGVAYVEPTVNFTNYVRANGKLLSQFVGGANIPNEASRFKQFTAGKMISAPNAEEAVVTERFTRDFGFGKPADAVGQTIELLAPSEENKQPTAKKEEEEPPNFFGIPLEDEGLDESKLNGIETHRFKITGVLGEIKEGVGQGGLRGLMPGAGVYVPLAAAHDLAVKQRGAMGQVALSLARTKGTLGEGQVEGYELAVVRVTDPATLTEVQGEIAGLYEAVDRADAAPTAAQIAAVNAATAKFDAIMKRWSALEPKLKPLAQ